MRLYNIAAFIIITLVVVRCRNGKEAPEPDDETYSKYLEARLEKKSICRQRVVVILAEKKDGLQYAPGSTDEISGKIYQEMLWV